MLARAAELSAEEAPEGPVAKHYKDWELGAVPGVRGYELAPSLAYFGGLHLNLGLCCAWSGKKCLTHSALWRRYKGWELGAVAGVRGSRSETGQTHDSWRES